MDKPVYFISDAHLSHTTGETKPSPLQAFLSDIETKATALYIVGDYFDFWFDYHHVLPKQNVAGLHWLLRLRDRGVAVHYLTGNHDHWQDDFLHGMGIEVYGEPFLTTVFGKKVYLIHGDGLSERDGSYRRVRRFLRNGLNRWLFRWLHPDIGVALANRWSRHSRLQDRAFTKYQGDESYWRSVESFFQNGADIVVMGHHHQPMERTFGSKTYYNLGDWIKHFSYLEADAAGFRLKRWSTS